MEILQKSRRSQSLVGETNIHGSSDQSENGNSVQSGPIAAAPTYRSGFLNQKFVGKTLAFVDEFRELTDKVPPSIVGDLEESFAYWANIQGKNPIVKYPEGLDHFNKVRFLYQKIRKLVPKKYGVNIEYTPSKGGRFLFLIYWEYPWGQTLFFIPIEFLELIRKNNRRLYRFFVSWVHFISERLGLPLWDINGLDEHIDSLKFRAAEMIETGDKEYLPMAEEILKHIKPFNQGVYSENLKKIRSTKPSLRSLKIQLKNVKTFYLEDEFIIELMTKGMEFVKQGQNIFRYEYNPTNHPEAYIIPFEYIFGFTWSVNDEIFSEYHDFLNMEVRNSDYIAAPVYTFPLIDINNRQFKEDNWPIEFKNWLNELASTVELYKKYKK